MDTEERSNIAAQLKPFIHMWVYFGQSDWNDAAFSYNKAMVCAAFSRAAYWDIPEYELAKKSRIDIIPSADYIMLKKKGISINMNEILRNADFSTNFIIETELAILVGILVQDVLFIAVRGTESLYDWMTDLRVLKTGCQSQNSLRYHKGFYRAAVNSVGLLAQKLEGLKEKFELIYLTGHSLGGGIAAILHSLMSPSTELSRNKYHQLLRPYPSFGCYTFGMPRFGNRAAVDFRSPFHLKHENDLVPKVPPTWLGYADSNQQTILPDPLGAASGAIPFWGWKKRMSNTIGRHKIESYYDSVMNITGDQRPNISWPIV